MTRAMVRLAVRTNILLLAVVGLVYIVWAERPGGTILGLTLCGLAVVAWRASRRIAP